jgi:hypothetical protein
MLAELERILTAAGGNTGHHGMRLVSPPRLHEDGTVQDTWMEKYLNRSHTPTNGSQRKRPRTIRSAPKAESVRQLLKTLTRDDTIPLCLKTLQRTQSLAEEQDFISEHYGDVFRCVGNIWMERTSMRFIGY